MKAGSRVLDQRREPSPEAFERPATITDDGGAFIEQQLVQALAAGSLGGLHGQISVTVGDDR
jgi:hypothetical protein